jgi:hypothetical protein
VWDVTADYSGGRQPARWLADPARLRELDLTVLDD